MEEMEIDINGLYLDEIKLKHDAFSIDPYFITGRFECVIDIERDFERRNTNDLVLKLGKNKYEIYDFKLIEPHVTQSAKTTRFADCMIYFKCKGIRIIQYDNKFEELYNAVEQSFR
jgi:hypothetical protein